MVAEQAERKLGLFDIDKTTYNGYVIFPLAESQVRDRTISQVCLDELQRDFQRYEGKSIDYETLIFDLLVHWAEGLKGIEYQKVLQQTISFFSSKGNKFFPYLRPTLELLKPTHDIYFVTGEPQFIGEAATRLFGATGYLASQLEVVNEVFSGRVTEPLARRGEKERAISGLLAKYSTEGSFGFGDSEGDIDMLNSTANPICINPTPGLEVVAIQKGWYRPKTNEVTTLISTLLS